MGIFAIFFLAGIVSEESSFQPKESMQSKSIEKVLEAHTDSLMSIKGVVGAGVSELNGKPCIKVMVDKKSRKLGKKIPKTIEGFPVVIEETGEFRARQRTPPY